MARVVIKQRSLMIKSYYRASGAGKISTGESPLKLSYMLIRHQSFWRVGQICAIFALVWGRFAVISFLLALQGTTNSLWRRAIYVVGGTQFLINTIEVILILKQCTPTYVC